MARVLNGLITEKGVQNTGIADVVASTYSVPVDANGVPTVHIIRVYNACVITLPPVVNGVELKIQVNFAATPENAVIILLDDAANETILFSYASYALTEPGECLTILGNTYPATDDWGGI